MRVLPEIGSSIWASVVFPGMFIETDQGERIEVQKVVPGYNTITFDNMWGRKVTVDYAARVEVLGYFNPDYGN
jgi:hypothetical protein